MLVSSFIFNSYYKVSERFLVMSTNDTIALSKGIGSLFSRLLKISPNDLLFCWKISSLLAVKVALSRIGSVPNELCRVIEPPSFSYIAMARSMVGIISGLLILLTLFVLAATLFGTRPFLPVLKIENNTRMSKEIAQYFYSYWALLPAEEKRGGEQK